MKIIEYGNNWLIEDQLDDELLNDIKNFCDKNLEFLYKDKENYSTTGDNVEQYWIEKRGEKPFYYENKEHENIKRRFREGIHGRLKAASLLKSDDDTQLRQVMAWTVIGEEGSYHTIHNHAAGRHDGISVVLYLNVPESEEKNKSNSIFLVLHTDPSSKFLNQGCPSIYHKEPEVGTLLIFPYHVPHGTYPQTKGIRQTFNVDYELYPKTKSPINYS